MKVELLAWAWSGQCAWASTALHALGAWLTSSGFAALGAFGAAYFAYKSVMKTIAADASGQQQKDQLEAMMSAIRALADSIQWVRNRNISIAGNATGEIWSDEKLWAEWTHHPAASRYAILSIARARLQLVGMDCASFDTARRLIDQAHDLALDRNVARPVVEAKEEEADKAIEAFAGYLQSHRIVKSACVGSPEIKPDRESSESSITGSDTEPGVAQSAG